MRYSTRSTLMLFAFACAIALLANPNVQAGNGWEWKKPINQRLGAFYTLNKAFKQPKSSARNGYRSSSHSTHVVTPVYSRLPAQVQLVPSSSSPPAPMQGQPVQVEIVAPTLGHTQSSAPPTNNTSGLSPNVQVTDASSGVQPDQETALSVEEQALQLLSLEPVIGIEPTASETPSTSDSHGAVRIAPSVSSSTSEPLPFKSTTQTFWE